MYQEETFETHRNSSVMSQDFLKVLWFKILRASLLKQNNMSKYHIKIIFKISAKLLLNFYYKIMAVYWGDNNHKE